MRVGAPEVARELRASTFGFALLPLPLALPLQLEPGRELGRGVGRRVVRVL